jgi:hypothetical protein
MESLGTVSGWGVTLSRVTWSKRWCPWEAWCALPQRTPRSDGRSGVTCVRARPARNAAGVCTGACRCPVPPGCVCCVVGSLHVGAHARHHSPRELSTQGSVQAKAVRWMQGGRGGVVPAAGRPSTAGGQGCVCSLGYMSVCVWGGGRGADAAHGSTALQRNVRVLGKPVVWGARSPRRVLLPWPGPRCTDRPVWLRYEHRPLHPLALSASQHLCACSCRSFVYVRRGCGCHSQGKDFQAKNGYSYADYSKVRRVGVQHGAVCPPPPLPPSANVPA